MKKIKLTILILILTFNFSYFSNAQSVPDSFADLAEKLMPSVVNISTTQTVVSNSNSLPFTFPPGSPFEDMFKEFGTPQKRKSSALGSGFIIDEKGIVVTNNHVIKDAEDIIVRVNGDEEYKATVIGADPLSDIAVLQLVETKEKFISVKFGDSDKARIGDWVIAIGNPFGLGGTVTSGIISARNRSIGLSRYEDYIQTDASINSGNSGGPLFDMKGDVIGINTAILGRNGSIGIGFSIPANSAKIVIDQLIEFGETKRGWLGVRIQDVTQEIADVEKLDEPRGALVASVAEGSPSEKAGIMAGDIILEFNGVKINQMKELPAIVAKTNVGKNVKVKVWRNKKELTKNVILGRLETSDDFKISEKKQTPSKDLIIEDLKITVRELTKEDIKTRKLPNQTKGLVITKIGNTSPLRNSISENSIIVEAQKTKIKDVNDLQKVIKSVMQSNQKTILFLIYNNQNQKEYVGVKLD